MNTKAIQGATASVAAAVRAAAAAAAVGAAAAVASSYGGCLHMLAGCEA